MHRAALAGVVGVCAAVVVVGCGPLAAPLPARLPVDQQKDIDAHWDDALSPVEKHDRQTWLDVFVCTQAYQAGVDTLDLRSEKKWAGGRVVMEIHFDRSKPADDRFEVTVTDFVGKVLRRERYGREEIEKAVEELNARDLPPKGAAAEPPEIAARRAAHEARLKRVEGVFPQLKDDRK